MAALTGRWGSDEDSSDDEVTFEELATTYRKLCHKSVELCKQVESQKKEITQLENEKVEHLETISKLKTEAVILNAKLDESQQVESQKKVIAQLENEKAEHLETISKLKTEAIFLNSKLDEMTKYVRMLGRQFNRLLKKMDVRSKANVKNIASDISKSNNIGRRTRSDEKPKEGKGVQCHECDGYGHIRT